MEKHKPILTILNIYHMEEGGKHGIEGVTDDVLSPKRQKEIKLLVKLLAYYKPTKILVEAIPEKENEINQQYQAFLKGEHELSRNEIEQVGFRLAKMLKHSKIYCVDDFNDKGAGIIQPDAFDKYKNNEFYKKIVKEGEQEVIRGKEILNRKGLIKYLLYLNSPEFMERDQCAYLILSQVGEEFALWVQWWYGRNLKIFLNILRIAEPDARLLLIIGSGHGYLLREMVKASDELKLLDIRKYIDRFSV